MLSRTIGTTAALLILVAAIGAGAGPDWSPTPLRDHIVPATADTTIAASGTTPEPAGTYEVKDTVITVQLDGAAVEAQIKEPVGGGSSLPAVLFFHGAGTGKFAEAFQDTTDLLASSGIVTMIPNKRLDTYTLTHRDYVSMASDYERSLDILQTWPRVDAHRTGIYCESEGCWISPVLAARRSDIAFSAMVSPPVVPARWQGAFAADTYLRNTGVPNGVFRAIPRLAGVQMQRFGLDYFDFDVTPYLRQQEQPTLVVYGTADYSMPIEQGALEIINDLAYTGNADVTVRYYGGANHGIRYRQDDGRDQPLVPEFPRDLGAWIHAVPADAWTTPKIAGAQPNQEFLAGPVKAPRWIDKDNSIVQIILVGLGLLAIAPLALVADRVIASWRVRRGHPRARRRRRFVPGLGQGLVALGVGAPVLVVGLIAYILAIAELALSYRQNWWIAQGGWLLLRILGVLLLGVAAVIVDTFIEVYRRRSDLRRATDITVSLPWVARGVAANVALWATVAGSAVLIFVLAYWGLYQIGI